MNGKEPASSVNLGFFDLPFMANDPNDRARDDDGEQILDSSEVRQLMEEAVPPEASELGSIEDETDNFTSWQTNDKYFITPLQGGPYDWALFRITWDDNWGRWGWCGDGRISGCEDQQEAARRMLGALFENWGYDLNDDERKPYREFLKNI